MLPVIEDTLADRLRRYYRKCAPEKASLENVAKVAEAYTGCQHASFAVAFVTAVCDAALNCCV